MDLAESIEEYFMKIAQTLNLYYRAFVLGLLCYTG